MRRAFERCPRLLRLGFRHGFGTRYSDGRRPAPLATARQVHGTRLVRADAPDAPEAALVEADALFTTTPDLAVAVRTADCVPILVADRGGRAVAAIHAGWRGSVAGIAERSIAGLCAAIAAQPSELLAVIGPHIGPCCYEVDAPVIEAVRETAALRPSTRLDRAQLDLFELNRRQLVAAGVPADAVLRVPGCTACDPIYASYRRDRTAERMVHFIQMPRDATLRTQDVEPEPPLGGARAGAIACGSAVRPRGWSTRAAVSRSIPTAIDFCAPPKRAQIRSNANTRSAGARQATRSGGKSSSAIRAPWMARAPSASG
jgi:hypothetical protein